MALSNETLLEGKGGKNRRNLEKNGMGSEKRRNKINGEGGLK